MSSPCVRLSVCLSVTSRCCIETTGRIELVLSWMLASCHCIVRKFGYLSEIRILPSGIMSQTLDLEISPQLDRVVNRAHRRTSLFITLTTVDAPSDWRHIRLLGGLVVEWFACWTQAQKARVQIAAATLSGNSLRQTVHTYRTAVHQAAKLVAALLRVARVTAGLAESNGSLPPGLWLTSPAGWLPRTGISSGTLRSVIEYGLAFLHTFTTRPSTEIL